MDQWLDYYRILQVHPSAEPEIIESAYKRLSKMYHPDLNPTLGSDEQMKRINAAYAILRNPTTRSDFHRAWQEHTKVHAIHASPPTVDAPSLELYQKAYQVMTVYFSAIAKEEYDVAYRLLTQKDQNRIPIQDFLTWQKAVARLYRIEDFSVRLIPSKSPSVTDIQRRMQFTIETTEKNRKTGETALYKTAKTLYYENNAWYVHLGYDDLKPLINRFELIANTETLSTVMDTWLKNKELLDMDTGLANRIGFMKQAEQEVYRHHRYHAPFTILVIQVSIPIKDSNQSVKVWQSVSKALQQGIRRTDFIAHLGNGIFAVLLSQTEIKEALAAGDKLMKQSREALSADNLINIKVYAGVSPYRGDSVEAPLSFAIKLASLALNQNYTKTLDTQYSASFK